MSSNYDRGGGVTVGWGDAYLVGAAGVLLGLLAALVRRCLRARAVAGLNQAVLVLRLWELSVIATLFCVSFAPGPWSGARLRETVDRLHDRLIWTWLFKSAVVTLWLLLVAGRAVRDRDAAEQQQRGAWTALLALLSRELFVVADCAAQATFQWGWLLLCPLWLAIVLLLCTSGGCLWTCAFSGTEAAAAATVVVVHSSGDSGSTTIDRPPSLTLEVGEEDAELPSVRSVHESTDTATYPGCLDGAD